MAIVQVMKSWDRFFKYPTVDDAAGHIMAIARLPHSYCMVTLRCYMLWIAAYGFAVSKKKVSCQVKKIVCPCGDQKTVQIAIQLAYSTVWPPFDYGNLCLLWEWHENVFYQKNHHTDHISPTIKMQFPAAFQIWVWSWLPTQQYAKAQPVGHI